MAKENTPHLISKQETRIKVNFILAFEEYLFEWINEMEKIAEGISDFGDFKATMFRTSDGRHFVRIEPLNSSEKAHIEWLGRGEHLEWLRVWSTHLGLSQ
jgi:hypothetical protein